MAVAAALIEGDESGEGGEPPGLIVAPGVKDLCPSPPGYRGFFDEYIEKFRVPRNCGAFLLDPLRW